MNLSEDTKRQYSASWKDFERWCDHYNMRSLPADQKTVANFLVDRSQRFSEATLRKRLTAIEYFHRVNDKRSPTEGKSVNELLEYVSHWAPFFDLPTNDLAAVLSSDERLLLDACEGPAKIDLRDKLLVTLLIAFDMKRSLAHSLEVRDLRTQGDILVLNSEHDSGRRIADNRVLSSEAKYAPVPSFRAWVRESGITSGPLFRSIDRHGNVGPGMSEVGIYKAVRKRATSAGLQNFSPMMLRSVPEK